jgi:hypothetical protein
MLKQLFGFGQASVQKYVESTFNNHFSCQPEPGEGLLISVKCFAKVHLTWFSI